MKPSTRAQLIEARTYCVRARTLIEAIKEDQIAIKRALDAARMTENFLRYAMDSSEEHEVEAPA